MASVKTLFKLSGSQGYLSQDFGSGLTNNVWNSSADCKSCECKPRFPIANTLYRIDNAAICELVFESYGEAVCFRAEGRIFGCLSGNKVRSSRGMHMQDLSERRVKQND